jgi:carboxyl-terminal processing protease
MKKLYFLILLILVSFSNLSKADQDEAIYESLSTFTRIIDLIERNYVEKVDPNELTTNAIQSMLNSLDPYSIYLSPDKYKELEVGTSGEFGGIGMEITLKSGILTVVSPLVDTPAFKAGIEAGDQILEIEGYKTDKMNEFEAVKILRGPKGTEVTIKIKKNKNDKIEKITLIRDIIRIKSVSGDLYGNNIGYIKLVQFQDKTSQELGSAIEELESESGSELNGLILDLRNNPGGLLTQAVEVVDVFLDEGIIVSVKGRNKNQNLDYYATKGERTIDYPMIVLVNKGSASASEVVAEALQDRKRSKILGTQTFGKGSVQTIIKLDDGSGLKITTAKFYAPSGRSIDSIGVMPDIVIENNNSDDIQLVRALELLRSN